MGKISAFDMVSADGFFDKLNAALDWHHVDAEFNEFAIKQLNESDLLLFGRTTYEIMARYWPSEQAVKSDPLVAEKMNSLPKHVFSKSPAPENSWSNTKFFSEINKEEIQEWKQTYKNILVLGSGIVTNSLAKLGLLDELRFMVNPVILGDGKKIFTGSYELVLISSEVFKSGNVLNKYKF